jgi:hypothetical protein
MVNPEKTEGAIKNGQSRDTAITGHTRQRTKINKIKAMHKPRIQTKYKPLTIEKLRLYIRFVKNDCLLLLSMTL